MSVCSTAVHFYTLKINRRLHFDGCSTQIDKFLTIGLVAHAQDDFWCPVVTRHHIRCHQKARGSRPSQAKVQDLQRAIRLDDDVARLEVLQRKTHQKVTF